MGAWRAANFLRVCLHWAHPNGDVWEEKGLRRGRGIRTVLGETISGAASLLFKTGLCPLFSVLS